MKLNIYYLAFTCFISVYSTFSYSQTATAPSGGGTLNDPYLIANEENLYWVSQNSSSWGSYFSQTNNIYYSGMDNWESGAGWTPIGNATTLFTGVYYGNGLDVSGIYINRPTEIYNGLFGLVGEGAQIIELHIISFNITGAQATGSLVGKVAGSNTTLIEGCQAVNGTVSGLMGTAGLVGANNSVDETTGGTNNPVISKCYANGVYVHGRETAGGITERVGGLVGCNQKGNVFDSYAINGEVSVDENGTFERLGGLSGCGGLKGEIVNCFSNNVVANDGPNNDVTRIGGICGFLGTGGVGNQGTVTDSYWDTETSGQATTAYKNGGTTTTGGLTTAEMILQASYSGFDFTNIWDHDGTNNDGFPFLRNIVLTTYNVWTGNTNSTLNNSGNWSQGRNPNSNDIVLINSANNSPVIASSAYISLDAKIVNLEAPGQIEVEAGGHLTITGSLRTDSARMIVNSSMSVSGSLIVDLPSYGYINYNRYLDVASKAPKWHYISSPLNGQVINDTWLSNNSITGPPYTLYRWDEDAYYWIVYGSTGNPEAFNDASFISGKAYSVKRSTSGDVTFTGNLNFDDVNYPASYTASGGEGWNLVGNPFASYIGVTNTAASASNFLTENAALLDDNYEAIYIWDEDATYDGQRNDYKTISNAGTGTINQDYLAPGQGFMAKVQTNGNLLFSTDMTTHASDAFFKSKEIWPGIKLELHGPGVMDYTEICFHENMSLGLDPSYDAAKLKGSSLVSIFTKLIDDNGKDFAIQALPFDTENDIIVPLGVELQNPASYTFKAALFDMGESQVFLEDRIVNQLTNLKNNTYTVDLSGENNNRFYLHFKNMTGTTDKTYRYLEIFALHHQIFIKNPNDYQGSIIVYNMIGQSIINTSLNNQNQVLNIPDGNGVYLVVIDTDESQIIKKILMH